MEKEINRILERLSMQVISLDEARAEMRILGLFNVVERSEQLSCSTCKWLNRTDDYCDTCFNFKKHEPAT